MECEPLNLDLSKFTEDIDPKLRIFVNNATKSTRCRKGAVSNVEISHTRFQILCQLIFCTNPSCPTPMHYLLADAIEICGGSRDLIRVLNRLGSVVSNDTYDRFVAAKSEVHRVQTMWEHLDEKIFTITTVDNFDKNSRHAMVRSGSQPRGYHGTTLMVIQPDPHIVLVSSQQHTVTTSNLFW